VGLKVGGTKCRGIISRRD